MKKQTAQQAYTARKATAEALLKEIGQLIQAHAKDAPAGGVHWGYVGDLGYVVERLVDIRLALTGDEV